MKITRIINAVKQRIYKAIYKGRKNDTYILMLHEVTDGENAKYPEISIDKDCLEKLICAIQEKGYSFEKVDNIFNFKSKRVIVTFDDIFANVITNAVPLLEKYNIPFVVFITAEYIDQPGYINTEQLKGLINNPLCTIGFHGTEHVLMREYTNEEIARLVDARPFEEQYGIKCDYFAYPYGSMYACPKRAVQVVSNLNYKAAFGTIDSAVNKQTIIENRYYIPRVCTSSQAADKIVGKLYEGVENENFVFDIIIISLSGKLVG